MQDPYADHDGYDGQDLVTSHEPLSSPIAPSSSWTAGDSELEQNQSSHHGLEALSAAATADSYTYGPFRGSAERTVTQLSSPRNFTPSTNTSSLSSHSPLNMFSSTTCSIDTPRSRSDIMTPIDPNLETTYSPYTKQHARTKSLQMRKISVVDQVDDEHEIAFLLRHYAESAGYA